MNLFKFEINKEACFVYWAQYMAGWSWNKKEKEREYYLNIINGLNIEEEKSLNKLKEILNKSSNHGYLWLWDRYNGKPITEIEEKEEWNNIKEVLNESFEKVWASEYPKLKEWEKILSSFKINNSMKEVVSETEEFFNTKLDFPVTVQFHFHGGENNTTGAAKKEFPGLILLSISNLNPNFTTKAIDTMFHELTHLVYYSSNKRKLVIDVLNEKMSEGNILFFKEDSSKWRNIFEESIMCTIAGRNFGYFTRKVGPSLYMKMNDKEEFEKFDYRDHKDNLAFQAQTVAYHLRDLTKDYLESKKEMDKEYLEKLVECWNKYRK